MESHSFKIHHGFNKWVMASAKKTIQTKLITAKARSVKVSELYEKVCEDNAVGKITDERFM